MRAPASANVAPPGQSRRKPHSDDAGYVGERINRDLTGRHFLTIYDAPKAGLCADAGRWTVLCQAHSTCVSVSSLRVAYSVLRSGGREFCDCCRGECGESCIHPIAAVAQNGELKGGD